MGFAIMICRATISFPGQRQLEVPVAGFLEGRGRRGQRQLEFPVFEGWSILATSCTQEVCDGHGWSSAEAVSGLGFREVVGGGGQEGWDGRKDGTQVSRV